MTPKTPKLRLGNIMSQKPKIWRPNDNAVYNNKSRYCGTLKQSFFRDIGGHVVAFLKGAKNGPALPSLKSLPNKPTKKPRPSSKVVPPTPVPKPIKHSWSKLNWDDFI